MNKEDLATGLTHALRGEITTFKFAEHSDSAAPEAVLAIERLIDRVDVLLKIRDGQFELQRTDVQDAIHSSINTFEPTQRKRIKVELNDATVRVDSQLLHIVLDELIQNALSYSEGPVYISTHSASKKLVIRIEDEGEGIPNHIASKIASPFIASDNPRSGHGLGLAIAWEATEYFGGALTVVTDEESAGTTVLLTLDLL